MNLESAIEETAKMKFPSDIYRVVVGQQVTDSRRRTNPRLHEAGMYYSFRNHIE